MRERIVVIGIAAAGLALGACTPAKSPPPVHGFVLFDTVGTHSFTVPAGTYQLAIDAYGAEGGHGDDGGVGGRGGRQTGTVAVTPGEALQVNVGGKGGDSAVPPGGTGGFYGGAVGGTS